MPLSKDHRADDEVEKERVRNMGGLVMQRYGTGCARVMGVLAVTRALGDASLKAYVTAEPDVVVVRRAEEHWFHLHSPPPRKSVTPPPPPPPVLCMRMFVA